MTFKKIAVIAQLVTVVGLTGCGATDVDDTTDITQGAASENETFTPVIANDAQCQFKGILPVAGGSLLGRQDITLTFTGSTPVSHIYKDSYPAKADGEFGRREFGGEYANLSLITSANVIARDKSSLIVSFSAKPDSSTYATYTFSSEDGGESWAFELPSLGDGPATNGLMTTVTCVGLSVKSTR